MAQKQTKKNNVDVEMISIPPVNRKTTKKKVVKLNTIVLKYLVANSVNLSVRTDFENA